MMDDTQRLYFSHHKSVKYFFGMDIKSEDGIKMSLLFRSRDALAHASVSLDTNVARDQLP